MRETSGNKAQQNVMNKPVTQPWDINGLPLQEGTESFTRNIFGRAQSTDKIPTQMRREIPALQHRCVGVGRV